MGRIFFVVLIHWDKFFNILNLLLLTLALSKVFFLYNHTHDPGLKIRGILVANATMFSHLLPGFSCGSKHLLLP